MEPWNAFEIKKLRLRLGWSKAEMARHLGCSLQLVSELELGEQGPDQDVKNLMAHLQSWVDRNSEETLDQARAEQKLHDGGLAQLHRDDLDS